jgi:GT2 family glycosyltransferase
MSTKDAINGYRLFLGRNPDSERVAEERGSVPLLSSVGGFITSPEFAERVFRPLLHCHPLPHTRMAALPAADLIEWAAAELPVSDAVRQKLLDSKSWRQLLVYILSDSAFFERIGLPFDERSASTLTQRYIVPWSSGQLREIVGAVDDASSFEVRGWAANLFDIGEAIHLEFLLDNYFLGTVQCSALRRDIQESIGGTGAFGFSFVVPAAHYRALQTERLLVVRDAISKDPISVPMRLGAEQGQVLESVAEIRDELTRVRKLMAHIESTLPDTMAKLSYPLTMYHDYQEEARRIISAARPRLQAATDALANKPLMTIVIPDSGAGAKGLLASVRSLQEQIYGQWECIIESIGHGVPTERSVLLHKITAAEPRLRTVETEADTRATALNQLFGAANGQYAMKLAQGDVLTENALFEVAKCLQGQAPEIVYFDEDTVSIDDFRRYRFHDPRLKPDFDYDLLLSSNYIGQSFVFRKDLFERVGGLDQRAGEAAFLDLLLRMIENGSQRGVAHATGVLFHAVERRGRTRNDKPAEAEVVECLNAHLGRTSPGSTALPHEDPFGHRLPNCQRIRWNLPSPAPSVSIIIPTRDSADLLRQCLLSLFDSLSEYPGKTEIIVVDHESRKKETHALLREFQAQHGIRVVSFAGAFNWAAINNSAAQSATGDLLVFLNNDTMVLSRDWLVEFASQLARPSVGVVGARLLYEDGTVQHGGVLLGVFGGAIHEGVGQSVENGGYMGRTVLQRNALAVTGACMATRAALFRQLGGFDESNLGVEFNDTDYCLRVHDRGQSVIYTPFATLYHFESKSRGFSKTEEQERRNLAERSFVSANWRQYLEHDPYYNPHFERFSRPFSRLRHPELLDKPLLGTTLAEDTACWFD